MRRSEEIQSIIGRNLHRLRKEKNFLGKDIGKACGSSSEKGAKTWVSLVEHGKGASITVKDLVILSNMLECDVSCLLEGVPFYNSQDKPELSETEANIIREYRKLSKAEKGIAERLVKGKEELSFLKNLDKLGYIGRTKLKEYLADLLEIPKYLKTKN